MTRLIVEPIDRSAPGSYRQARELMRLGGEIAQIHAGADLANVDAILDRVEQAILARARTDDGTPVAEAIAQMSFDDFTATINGILGRESVPPVNGEPSPSPSTESADIPDLIGLSS